MSTAAGTPAAAGTDGIKLRAIALFAAIALGGCASVATSQGSLDNSSWAVAAINGRPTPASGEYRLEFAHGGIGGRLGCNSIGGRYSIAGEILTVRDLASTLMGCPEPAASFESQGTAILAAPMRITWTSGRQLTLSNARGSIALQQI